MEKETIIIQAGKKSSCLKETKFCGNPKTDCISVHVGNPETVTVLEGHPKLYRESDMKAERLAGQYEAWTLAQKILNQPCNGGYTAHELTEIFCTDGKARHAFDIIRGQSYSEAADKVNEWEEKQAKEFHPGDVVTLTWGSKEKTTAVVTFVMPILLTILLPDGNTDTVKKSRCTKTGKTLNIPSMLCDLNEMEEN